MPAAKILSERSAWLSIIGGFNPELYSTNQLSTNIEDMISFHGYQWQNPLPIWKTKAQDMVAGIFCAKDGQHLQAILPREDVLKMTHGKEFLNDFEPKLKELNKKFYHEVIWDSFLTGTAALGLVLGVEWLSRI